MASLYQLTQEEVNLERLMFEQMNEETGEIEECEVIEDLEGELKEQVANKINSIIRIMINKEALANSIKEEKKRLNAAQKKYEKQVESLKNLVKTYMEGTEKKKFETELGVFSLRKSVSLYREPGAEFPEEFLKKEIVIKEDLAGLKKYLKTNQVKNFGLVEGTTISFK
jgi:hypothetical protein